MSDGSDDEMIRRLFVEATIVLESAHEIAIRGQAERLDGRGRRHAAKELGRAARALEGLARTAALLSRAPSKA